MITKTSIQFIINNTFLHMTNLKDIFFIILVFVLVICQEGGGFDGDIDWGVDSSTQVKETLEQCRNECQSKNNKKKNCLRKCDIKHISWEILLAKCEKKCQQDVQFNDSQRSECLESCKKEFTISSLNSFILIGVIATLWICSCIDSSRKKNNIIKQLKAVFIKEQNQNIKQFEVNESEIEQLAQSFVSKKLAITFNQLNKIYTTQKFLITLSKKDKFLYDINFTTEDYFGKANYEGYISFSSKGYKLWMMKNYEDAQTARQTGKWKYLIYKGAIVDNSVTNGIWYFNGFERDSKYSGTWKMEILKGQ